MPSYTRKTKHKPPPKPDNIPKVWANFLSDIEKVWGKDSRQLKEAKSHEAAILAAVRGRDDCYLYPYHAAPVVYRKPSYRDDYVPSQIRLSEIGYRTDATANDKATLAHNAIEDYVRSLIVYPDAAKNPATFEELLAKKPNIVSCLRAALDVIADDAIEAEEVKFRAPSPTAARPQ